MAGSHRSEWAAIASIAAKVGVHQETPRLRGRRAQVDAGQRPALTSDVRERLRQTGAREQRADLANEILEGAPAFFAAELDGRRPG